MVFILFPDFWDPLSIRLSGNVTKKEESLQNPSLIDIKSGYVWKYSPHMNAIFSVPLSYFKFSNVSLILCVIL